MKLIFTFTFLVLMTHLALGQHSVNEKRMVGFGCFYAGQPTKTVIKVTELLKDHKYKNVSRLLKTGNGAEKFLAVIALEKLSTLGRYELSDNEKKLINQIKSSRDKVHVCSGCTYFDQVSLNDMFSNDNFLGSSWWINEILQ